MVFLTKVPISLAFEHRNIPISVLPVVPRFTLVSSPFPLTSSLKFSSEQRIPTDLSVLALRSVFLFPFDGRRWFAADIIANPIYPFYFIDNSSGDGGEQIIGQA